jgi:hypothetical protein
MQDIQSRAIEWDDEEEDRVESGACRMVVLPRCEAAFKGNERQSRSSVLRAGRGYKSQQC